MKLPYHAIIASLFFLIQCNKTVDKYHQVKEIKNASTFIEKVDSNKTQAIEFNSSDSLGDSLLDTVTAKYITTEIPILDFEAPTGEVDALLDTAEEQYLTVGHGFSSDSLTEIYYEPKPGLSYHVISPFGEDMYLPSEIKRGKQPHCEGETLTVWKVRFSYSASSNLKWRNEYIRGLIVIGTKNKTFFSPPIIEDIPDSIKVICANLLKSDTLNYNVKMVPAGILNGTRRIFISFNNVQSGCGFVGVVDTDGNNYKVLFKTNDHWCDFRQYNGQADINNDGLSDVFLVNYNDYGAFNIFVERNGKWIVIHNHGPQEC